MGWGWEHVNLAVAGINGGACMLIPVPFDPTSLAWGEAADWGRCTHLVTGPLGSPGLPSTFLLCHQRTLLLYLPFLEKI